MHCVGGDDVHVTWRIVYSLNMYTRWGFFVVVCDLRWLENLTIALIYDVSVSYGKSKISWWFKQLSMCIEEEEKEKEEKKSTYTDWPSAKYVNQALGSLLIWLLLTTALWCK